MILGYTFFKIYISKICNGFLLYTHMCVHAHTYTHTHIYIYIYDLEFHWF